MSDRELLIRVATQVESLNDNFMRCRQEDRETHAKICDRLNEVERDVARGKGAAALLGALLGGAAGLLSRIWK